MLFRACARDRLRLAPLGSTRARAVSSGPCIPRVLGARMGALLRLPPGSSSPRFAVFSGPCIPRALGACMGALPRLPPGVVLTSLRSVRLGPGGTWARFFLCLKIE